MEEGREKGKGRGRTKEMRDGEKKEEKEGERKYELMAATVSKIVHFDVAEGVRDGERQTPTQREEGRRKEDEAYSS